MGINIEKINRRFRSLGLLIINRRIFFLLLFVLLVAASFPGIKGLKANYSNDSWFLDDDPLIKVENVLKDIFGNNTNCAVLMEVDEIFEKEILEKIRDLGNEVEENVPYADDVISIADLEFIEGTEWGMDIGQLIPDEIPSDRKSLDILKIKALSKPSIRNKLVSADSTESWLILRLLNYPENWNTDKNHFEYIQREAERNPELYKGIDVSKPVDPEDIAGVIFKKIVRQEKYDVLNRTASGLPVLISDKREFFAAETPRLMMYGLLVSIFVLAVSLRSLRGVLFPVITAVCSMIITFGLEGYFHAEFDPSMILIPAFLGLAVSIGYSIHVFSFFRQNVILSGDRKDAAVTAVEEIGWPLLFTALTTIAALTSFQFIQVKTLRWVGMTSSLMIAVTYILSVFFFPALLSFGKAGKMKLARAGSRFGGKYLEKIGKWTTVNPVKISLVYAVFSVVCVLGLMKIEVSFDIKDSMGDGIPYVKKNPSCRGFEPGVNLFL